MNDATDCFVIDLHDSALKSPMELVELLDKLVVALEFSALLSALRL
ncbi:hypothetical protein KR100_06670 [Synechococcus sp. KORDI-100]|nr:hypothetical protein KR100_06670 [Synechococcus sp. KORDI-100]